MELTPPDRMLDRVYLLFGFIMRKVCGTSKACFGLRLTKSFWTLVKLSWNPTRSQQLHFHTLPSASTAACYTPGLNSPPSLAFWPVFNWIHINTHLRLSPAFFLQLLCPKCTSKLGSFSWRGDQCSCGRWVTPAFQIHKSRVDEVRTLPVGNFQTAKT